MTIRMPTFTDLSQEQRGILRDIPFEGTSIVVGPPGTGKTVIAMFRALAISKSEDATGQTTFITHSKVLTAHSETWREDGFDDVDLRTYHSFIHRIWCQHGGKGFAPARHGASSNYEKDWFTISQQLKASHRTPSLGHIVVDEGQDLPVDFYQTMAMYVLSGWVESFTVFADENQRLDPESNSTIAQIRGALGSLSTPIELPLTENFRNTLPIAKTASSFFVGATSDQPKFPENRPGSPVEMRICDDESVMAERVAVLAGNDRSRSILVICGTQAFAKKMRNKIEMRIRKSGLPHPVTWYKSKHEVHGDPAALKAGENGVISVVHTSSMKGLEADAVFVAGLEHLDKGAAGLDVEKMNLYVTTSRARSSLEILFENKSSRLVREVASGISGFLSPRSVDGLKSKSVI